MAIISFGWIDKKLLFIAAIIIVHLINSLIILKFPYESNTYMTDITKNIGSILIGIILYLILNKKKKKIQANKRNFKYNVYLFLLLLMELCYDRLYNYFNKKTEYDYNIITKTLNGVEMMFVTFGASLLLKYKYYIHHIISIAIYFLLGIINDFILGNFFVLNYTYIVCQIIYICMVVMISCYFKYMMDKLYYNYYELIIYWGIIELIIKLLIYSMLAIYEYKSDIDADSLIILNNIYAYFTKTDIYIIIFYQFFIL